MLRFTTAVSLILLPMAAAAQTVPPVGTSTGAPVSSTAQAQAETGRAPSRIRNVQLTGNDKCPVAQGDEVVVCSRINPDEGMKPIVGYIIALVIGLVIVAVAPWISTGFL